MRARRVTVRDVAEASGVSVTTVSFVLNAVTGQRISTATRDRVLRVARELGYVPHGVAKALREGTSRIVLLGLPPGLRGGSLDGYLHGLDDELAKHGHTLLVRHGKASLAPVVAALSPRGVIDLTGLYESEPATNDDTDDGGWVNGLAAHTMVQLRHLAETGHRNVAVARPDDPGWARLAEVRLRYARAAATQLGLNPLATLTIPADAAEAARKFRRDNPSVTAVAAFDDRVALRLLSALRGSDIAVPKEIAVIGFDDNGYGAFTTPALTSVHIDAESFGRRAGRAALGLDTEDTIPPAATIVARESA